MPPRFKFTREEIIESATRLVTEKSAAALTARGLAEVLGTSSKPIFGLFSSMDEVKAGVIERARTKYIEYVEREKVNYPDTPYKAYGMGYIRFAMEDRELFRLLYMRDRSREQQEDSEKALAPLIKLIQDKTGLDAKTAYIFHLEMWLFIHGIATTIVTSYGEWDWTFIDKMVNDQFMGLKQTLGSVNNASNKDRESH